MSQIYYSDYNIMMLCSTSIIFLLSLSHLAVASAIDHPHQLCLHRDRSALWNFKQSLTTIDKSKSSKIKSWKLIADCCSWDGVECNEGTAHVIGLDLSSSFLQCSLTSNSSLFNLLHLKKLNLAYNDFNSSHIPSAIANLSSLTHLNLSHSHFSGQVPWQVLHLSNLSSLDLSGNDFLNLTFSSMSWLASLSKLNHLGLNSVGINGQISPWLGNLTQLVEIDLGSNHLVGNIPVELMNLTQLASLLLGSNQLTGPIPAFLTMMTQLLNLDLSLNGFQGSVPNSFSHLHNLQSLDLYSNNLSGTVDLHMFHNLKALSTLELSSNNLSLIVNSSDSDVPKQYEFLGFASCNLQEFPTFLLNQNKLRWLDLSNNEIHGEIPKWIWSTSVGTLDFLNISHNFLTSFEDQPAILPWTVLRTFDISHNMLQGPLPVPPLSTNFYLVSYNRWKGKMSPLFCNLMDLIAFDVSYNNLSGMVPQCFGRLSKSLSILNVQGNNFSGPIPQSWMYGCVLKMINLSENQFQWKVPTSLVNCTRLEFIDFGINQLNGTFPSWLSDLPQLRVLCLRHNRLYGAMNKHSNVSQFHQLRILDLSFNSLSGKLPFVDSRYWKSMKIDDVDEILTYMQIQLQGDSQVVGSHSAYYDFTMKVTNKGMERVYRKIPNIFRGIDLSNNKFEGHIPASIGDLKGLHLLTLGGNRITGDIPPSLANLKEIESLDLSDNKLSGEIPGDLTDLTSLSFFNVSYNNLAGSIPRGNQFGTFENSSYEGNEELCGDPLMKKCVNLEMTPAQPPQAEEEEDSGMFGKIDLIVIFTGFGGGLVVGIVLGNECDKRKLCGRFLKFMQRRHNRDHSGTYSVTSYFTYYVYKIWR